MTPAQSGRPDRITDVHIHVQPWRELKPAALAVMDGAGVWRVGLVNYPSPDVMGFTDAANAFSARYAAADPQRLLPYGGVHPRFSRDPTGDVDRLGGLGVRLVKIHPPHQLFSANAYTEGLSALGEIYRRCEA